MSDTSGKGPENPSAAGTGSETPKPTSPARPRPPVIDLEAKELGKTGTAAGTTTPPPAPTAPPAQPSQAKAAEKPDMKPATTPTHPAAKASDDNAKKPSTTPPPPPSTGSATRIAGKEPSHTPLIAAGLGGAALATVLIFGLSAAGLLPNGQEQRVVTLEEDIVRLQDALSATQSPQGPDPRIAALERRLNETTDKLDGAILAAAAAGAGGDTAATADLAARLEQAEQGNAALSGRIDEMIKQRETLEASLRQRIDEVAKASGGQAADAVTKREHLALGLSAAAALNAALLRGAPYADELAAVRAFIPDANVAALTASAGQGIPPARVIAARWRQAVDAAPPPPPPADAGVVDRFITNARSLVQITPIGAPEGTDPGARRARLLDALDRADLSAALTEWNAMDETFRKATGEAAAQAKGRVDAEAASASLQASALGKAREAASAQ